MMHLSIITACIPLLKRFITDLQTGHLNATVPEEHELHAARTWHQNFWQLSRENEIETNKSGIKNFSLSSGHKTPMPKEEDGMRLTSNDGIIQTTDIRIDFNDAGGRSERSNFRPWIFVHAFEWAHVLLVHSSLHKDRSLNTRNGGATFCRAKPQTPPQSKATHLCCTKSTNCPPHRRLELSPSSSIAPGTSFVHYHDLRHLENRHSSLPWKLATNLSYSFWVKKAVKWNRHTKKYTHRVVASHQPEHCWPPSLATAHCMEARSLRTCRLAVRWRR